MSPFPLLLAAALAAEPLPEISEEPPGPVVAPVPIELPPAASPAAPPQRYGRPGDRPLALAGGMALGRYDDIPITLAVLRGSIVMLGPPGERRRERLGFGVSGEVIGGRTQRGLETGGFTVGPGLWAEVGLVRAGVGVEIGVYGVETATTRIAELMLVGSLRATAELDLWRGADATLFLGASGVLGNGTGIPIRAASASLGVRR